MNKTRNDLAFVVELLLLFVILLFVIVVITKTFMTSRSQSLHARHLTEAVCVAEEVAEATAAAADRAEAAELLESLEQAGAVQEDGDGISLTVDVFTENGTKDSYAVYLLWEEDAEGDFVEKTIRVHDGNGEEPLYTLKTGTYRTGDGHEP